MHPEKCKTVNYSLLQDIFSPTQTNRFYLNKEKKYMISILIQRSYADSNLQPGKHTTNVLV